MKRQLLVAAAFALACATAAAQKPAFEPYEGQPGKDVVWVPTPHVMTETLLDLAEVTPKDFVVDLGSGDGRLVVAAAKRGARALGVEWEGEMVALARRNAAAAGVGERASFVQGDMFEADISKATVLALFLLPDNLNRLVPKFLQLPAGTRIVNLQYKMPGWEEAKSVDARGACEVWCTAHLYLVPARVEGRWRLGERELTLTQEIQTISGTLTAPGGKAEPVHGKIEADRIRFTAGMDSFTGRVRGKEMSGEASGGFSGHWRASRQ